jgi:hypothetical protein
MARFNDRTATLEQGLLLLALVLGGEYQLTVASHHSSRNQLFARFLQTMCFTKKDDEAESINNTVKAQTWNPLSLGISQLGLTEPAMTLPLNYGKYNGKFKCAYCG